MQKERKIRLHGWAAPWIYPTGRFIRDFLVKHGEGYAQEIWRKLKEARASEGLSCCSLQSFRTNYIYVLKRLGLIESVRTERVRAEWHSRVYYQIVPGKEKALEWNAPQKAFDPRRGLGAKRYKREKLKAEVETRGRPPKYFREVVSK